MVKEGGKAREEDRPGSGDGRGGARCAGRYLLYWTGLSCTYQHRDWSWSVRMGKAKGKEKGPHYLPATAQGKS